MTDDLALKTRPCKTPGCGGHVLLTRGARGGDVTRRQYCRKCERERRQAQRGVRGGAWNASGGRSGFTRPDKPIVPDVPMKRVRRWKDDA